MSKTLLFLKFSPRQDSVSAGLAEVFVANWQTANPDAEILERDLGRQPMVGPDDAWIKANMTPEDQRSETQKQLLLPSDGAIADLHRASHIVIATPMFNFSIPWTFKAYIDLIVRVNKTFSFDPATGFGPLLDPAKKMLVVSASAGDYPVGSPAAPFDHLTPYVRFMFGFMGITQTEVATAGNQWGTPDALSGAMGKAQADLAALSAGW